MRPAYDTRLGNLTAKSVLVLIADQANAEGFCYPSLEFIVRSTEIRARTVRRVMEVFGQIGLVTKVDRGPKRSPGFQLNLELLGTDLREHYALCYRAARGRPSGSGSGPRDTEEKVSGTAGTVSGTKPPHPQNLCRARSRVMTEAWARDFTLSYPGGIDSN